jgi:hypothetical protein
MRLPGFNGADPVGVGKKVSAAAANAAGRSMQVKKAVRENQLRDENAKASRAREKERRERKDREAREAKEAEKEIVEVKGDAELNEKDDVAETELVFPSGELKHARGEDEVSPSVKRRKL